MNMQLSEEEQVEALKKWWKENGVSVIVGVVVGLSVIVGFWKWREYTEQRAYQASDIYVEFSEALAEKKDDTVKQRYDSLIKDYSGTSYAVLAAMQMAKQAAEKDELDKAATDLRWALEHAGQDALAHLARIRLAHVMVAQKKYDEALTLIHGIPASAFDAQYAEIKGDIYRHTGKFAEAHTAYQTALDSGLLTGKRRDFVQMKMSDLGSSTPTSTSEPAVTK
jgi:predicted negative regulator of RcsB-dependent stress response